MEMTAQALDKEAAQTLREGVKSTLKQQVFGQHKPNITKQQQKAIRDLNKDDILPADKGNSTVIMDREEYKKNIQDIYLTTV